MPLTFSIMTYNVHSCIGRNGRTSLAAIAQVIEDHNADIVALQELDVYLLRSGLMDQGRVIAEQLNMHCHFCPTLKIEEGHYGNAVLSRYPMVMKKTSPLPTLRGRSDLEQRAAMWVEVRIASKPVQIIVSHLGLKRMERLAQASELLSPEWLAHPDCRQPVVFCGDLNATPFSAVYKEFSALFVDTQMSVAGLKPALTWPSAFPIMRIDYIFVTPDISVTDIRLRRTKIMKTASDHLPVYAELSVPLPEDSR